MRILVGIPEKGSHGGPAACEPPFIDELRRLGHGVTEEIYAFGDTNVGVAGRVRRVFRTAQRFRHLVREGNYDIVHINTAFDTRALLRDAVILPRLTGTQTKIFIKVHGSDGRLLKTKNPLIAVLRWRLFSSLDGIGALSTEERSNFVAAGVSVKKVFVVKNVVETNSKIPRPDFLTKWNLSTNRPTLLFISRFIEAKGLSDVIRACGLLRDRGQVFTLLCLGDGPTRTEAEALCDSLDLNDSVRFFGYIPEAETADFYAHSSVLLFPTYHIEGFPMVIFNAAAAGLPIITTRIRAAADYLTEPENCLWVEPKDPGMLADRIEELFGSSNLTSSMAVNNKLLAARFDAQTVTAEYKEIYQRLMSAE